MGFMLDEDILMLMLTCGFGVGVTTMIWSEVGDAMNRTANLRTRIKTFTYVDNFLGGRMQARRIGGTRDYSRCTWPHRIVGRKNAHAQIADILGILVDCTKGALRPKDKVIEKLLFVAFSVDLSKRLPLSYW